MSMSTLKDLGEDADEDDGISKYYSAAAFAATSFVLNEYDIRRTTTYSYATHQSKQYIVLS